MQEVAEIKKLNIVDPLKVSYCIDTALRDQQILINIRKVKDRVEPAIELITEPIALVAFAPSLNETWEQLKGYKNIMTCSGAHKFLIERGVIPKYHVDLDPRPHKIQLLGTPHPEVEYLIASTVHPTYIDFLKANNSQVKLWHIFANDDEAVRIIPRGEWAVTGGSSVGLRLFTLARFLGYTDFKVFGMDGSFEEATHTTDHPNSPKEKFETEYNGKKYFTTPSMLFVAKETWKELDQLVDCNVEFFGNGLVQAMAKDYVRSPKHGGNIAFNKPELISKEFIDLNKKLHEDNPQYGMGGARHKDTVLKLAKGLNTTSILDYGCGKGMLAKALDIPIWEYDPAIPEKSAVPKPADLVICTDVLEHIEPDKLPFVLDDLKRCVKKVGYFVISTRAAVKTYSDGRNAHLIQQGKDWWNKKLQKYFNVGSITESNQELHVVVGVKTEKPEASIGDVMEIEHDGTKVKFHVPNETVKWRCNTLFKKEPITIQWIESFKEGETLIDIGANMGGYSIWAAKRKRVKVIAFEPEASNYALLQRNILLNDIDAVAYCAAISNKHRIDKLYLSQVVTGGSCHSFADAQGKKISQGCIALRLDDLDLKADHIKIDVDGFENFVVAGAEKLLSNGVKSVLMEVNTNIEEHLAMVKKMSDMGFVYETEQVQKSIRKDGAFKGCAEYLFIKKPVAKITPHIVRKINDTKLSTKPFNHLYLKNVFSPSTYKQVLSELKNVQYEEIEKTRGTRGYPKRFTGTVPSFLNEIMNGEVKKAILNKFSIEDNGFTEDLLLIKDYEGYQIPPHTDSLSKVISALFYLPENDSMSEEGTSLYVPKKEGFVCDTGRHYNFDDFEKVWTAPFKPNSCLIFARTDNSFHGVEPSKHVRNVLLYNIKK